MVARPASPQEDLFGAHIQVTGTVVVCLFLPPLSSTGAVGATGTASAPCSALTFRLAAASVVALALPLQWQCQWPPGKTRGPA